MAVNRNAGKTESRNRYILYLHKSKHADLCSFLDSLPNRVLKIAPSPSVSSRLEINRR